MVIVMVTDVDWTMGVATVTLWPRADDNESVNALASSAASVALLLRLLAASAGIEI